VKRRRKHEYIISVSFMNLHKMIQHCKISLYYFRKGGFYPAECEKPEGKHYDVPNNYL